MKAEPASTISAPVIPHPAAHHHRRRTLQRERQKPHRQRLEAKIIAVLERLEDLRQEYIARLDLLQGDCDLEDGGDIEAVCEDEGAQCEDEGWDDDLELDDYHLCPWPSGDVNQAQPEPLLMLGLGYEDRDGERR